MGLSVTSAQAGQGGQGESGALLGGASGDLAREREQSQLTRDLRKDLNLAMAQSEQPVTPEGAIEKKRQVAGYRRSARPRCRRIPQTNRVCWFDADPAPGDIEDDRKRLRSRLGETIVQGRRRQHDAESSSGARWAALRLLGGGAGLRGLFADRGGCASGLLHDDVMGRALHDLLNVRPFVSGEQQEAKWMRADKTVGVPLHFDSRHTVAVAALADDGERIRPPDPLRQLLDLTVHLSEEQLVARRALFRG